jgi:long-chain acyl-CoA synthetase
VTMKIVDEAGAEVPRGVTGEIWIRGPMNFRGYWNRPEDTRAALTDGWLHTGDVGHMDDEDYVFITDRAKDMVIRGGENIGCQEVEAVIYDHVAVSECAVFGLPDERWGETLAAVVMRKPNQTLTAEELKAHVGAHLARFKVPERVWIQDGQLPRIASGKIYKRGLRNEALSRLEPSS